METVEYKSVSFTVWDVGARDKARALWRHYYQNSNGVVWVVDANDRDRIGEAADELMRVMNADELRDAVLLVISNKHDLPTAMSLQTVRHALLLPNAPLPPPLPPLL